MKRIMTRALCVMLVAAAPLCLAACSSSSGSDNDAPRDQTPPTVVAHFPSDNAGDVTRTGPFWIAFSEPMNASLFPAGVAFTPPSVGFNTSWSGDTLVITPSTLLEAGAQYSIEIAGSVEDAHGNDLGSAHSVAFTTTSAADETPPVVSSTSPADGATGVGGVQTIEVTFNEPMNSSSAQQAVEVSPPVADVWTEWRGLTMSILHSAFAQNTLITITIGTGATDLSGNHLVAPFTFSFTTQADNTRPHLVSATPSNGASGVSTSLGQLVLTFSEPMDQTSFNMPPEYIDARINQAVEGEPSFNEDFTTVTVPLRDGLLPGCSYWVQFLNVRDAAGNLIDPNPTSYQFTTAGLVSFYPVAGDDVWHLIGPGDAQVTRMIENYNQGTGTFDEVFVDDLGGVREVVHLKKTSSGIQHLGRDEYRDGEYQFSMLWNNPLPYLSLPVDDHLGESWSFSTTSAIDDSTTMSLSGHTEVEASKVDLTSDAMHGTFKGCCVHHMYADYTMSVRGNPVDQGQVHQIMWLAPGVGPVQIVNSDGAGRSDTLRVVDWSL